MAEWSFQWSESSPPAASPAVHSAPVKADLPRHLNVTSQTICRYVQKRKCPVIAKDILQHLRETRPSIHKTTIYRNLDRLIEEEVLYTVEVGDGQHYYELAAAPRYHFVCQHCKHCERLPEGNSAYAVASLTAQLGASGYVIQNSNIIVNGLCTKCAGK